MRVIMQHKDNGKIIHVKKGIDILTLFCFFCLVGFLPSLFRKDYFKAFKLFLAQYLGVTFDFFGQYFKVYFFNYIDLIITAIGFIYVLYACCNNKNLDTHVENYKKKGYRIVNLNYKN